VDSGAAPARYHAVNDREALFRKIADLGRHTLQALRIAAGIPPMMPALHCVDQA
jgi:hypothetical protein